MKLLLATLHAKYVHASLALPSLAAAGGDIAGVEIALGEYTVNEPREQVLRRLVAAGADVVAFSCYIWNIAETLALVANLKKIRPGCFVILGGPESSYGIFELLGRQPAVDCIVRDEGEATFRDCLEVLAAAWGRTAVEPLLATVPGLVFRSGEDIVANPPRLPVAELDSLPSPFAAGLVDLGKPLVYYESSRGCPFSCAFCMSSLEKGVRTYSPARIEADLELLLAAGVQTIKFVDRTFNYDAARANAIWEFILRRNRQSRCHFEIAADLLTEENIRLLARVPAGMFRFEIGVQSGGEATLERVGRKSDLARLFEAVARLRRETGVILHLDLVAGLPQEDFTGFLASLERLFAVAPHHIQVEPLKVLKGAPMRRIAVDEEYAFSDSPPYTILQTPWLSFAEIGAIGTISRLLDLLYNSGRFAASLASLAAERPLAEVFRLAAAYWEQREVPANLSLGGVFTTFWEFGGSILAAAERPGFADALAFDFCRIEYPGGAKLPPFFDAASPQPPSRPKTPAPELPAAPPGSRVRTFTRTFARDYRHAASAAGPVELLFVYTATPGEKLRVAILAPATSGPVPALS